MVTPIPSPAFWRGRRVLLTGHTGFKGAWLAIWLQRLGATVSGISLPPATTPNLFELARVSEGLRSHLCDVRDMAALDRFIGAFEPEVVLHLAAQPLVRASYGDPVFTFGSNVMGTVHVLEAARRAGSVRAIVAVTTDKVYRDQRTFFPYRETDTLGGHDPYSASKAAAEIVIASYRDAFLRSAGVPLASVRAGNVIGGGDWSQDRLIPDAVGAWQAGRTLQVRNPAAVRPWQHVLEPLNAYLCLAERLWHEPALADAYNIGPAAHDVLCVREIVDLAREVYGEGAVEFGQADADGPHETHHLALETAKARHILGIAPHWSAAEAVRLTMEWYRQVKQGGDARALCHAHIDLFERMS
ncbi:CDP-glucose 4,6-dehydratase [Bordetella genomosp. 8]|uniref:CDP-glucose 4,6-dehydratase n=1 Tax=Bordetella genomosp. 8 TaxID=1416806 RepID=A0A1W6YK33_9BORD|nr:CDP-glucose 4,6-dehydratase [Bordetella genomosp. 8]ARP81412.1 CDP-glucose 4,6-dehydratase [Bordetella genomosp. 8]